MQAPRLPILPVVKDPATFRAAPSGKPDIVIQLPQLPDKAEPPSKPAASKGTTFAAKRETLPIANWRESLKSEREPTLERHASAQEDVKMEEPRQEEGIAVKAEVKEEDKGKHNPSCGGYSSKPWQSEWAKKLPSLRSSPTVKSGAIAEDAAGQPLLQRDISQYLAGRRNFQ